MHYIDVLKNGVIFSSDQNFLITFLPNYTKHKYLLRIIVVRQVVSLLITYTITFRDQICIFAC